MRATSVPTLPKRGFSIDEVVETGALGKRSTVYAMIASGALRARKVGRRTVIMSDDLQAAIDALPVVEPKSAA